MSHYKPDPNKSVNLTIDGIPVTVPEGTTILDAAKKVNIAIPSLCHFSGLGKRAVCRLCVVECDGRGKLVPACANDVTEGVKVVTNNLRILNIRKTIIELILTNHPPECLNCIKNKNCELQTLAADFGILKIPFRRDAADHRLPSIEGGTLVRNMARCVKCGRCVEVCQEQQTIRAINSSHRGFNYEVATPYGQSLCDGPCIFCGKCVEVCPVGAIYENEQYLAVRAELNKSGQRIVIQIPPSAAETVALEMGLAPGSITGGKLVTALKLAGFYKVINSGESAEITVQDEYHELLDRVKKHGKLPIITSCSPSFFTFVRIFYPDLAGHLPSNRKSPQQNFSMAAKKLFTGEAGTDNAPEIKTVSVMPCIANKFETWQPAQSADAQSGQNSPPAFSGPVFSGITGHPDFALTVKELVLLIRQSGIEIHNLVETPFDSLSGGSGIDRSINTASQQAALSASASPSSPMEAIIQNIYKAYTGKIPMLPAFNEVQENPGIKEAEAELNGTKAKIMTVNGLANARILLDSIRRGECNAAFIEIKDCSGCKNPVRAPSPV